MRPLFLNTKLPNLTNIKEANLTKILTRIFLYRLLSDLFPKKYRRRFTIRHFRQKQEKPFLKSFTETLWSFVSFCLSFSTESEL